MVGSYCYNGCGFAGKIGSVRTVKLPGGRVAKLKTMALEPVVLEVDNFLDPDETMHIKNIAGPHLEKSPVSLKVRVRNIAFSSCHCSAARK